MANGDAFEGAGTIGTGATAPEPQPARRSVRSTDHGLRRIGRTADEAGNLTAHLNGLPIIDHGLDADRDRTPLFVRALAARSRIA